MRVTRRALLSGGAGLAAAGGAAATANLFQTPFAPGAPVGLHTLKSSVKWDTGFNGGTTTAINTTGANLIIITASGLNGFEPPGGAASFTASPAVTFVQAPFVTNATTATWTGIWYAFAPATSVTHTFTNTTTFIAFAVAAFSGAVASPLDKILTNVDAIGSTAVSTGSITPVTSGQLIIAVGVPNQTTIVPTVDSGFTVAQGNIYTGGAHLPNILAYRFHDTGPVSTTVSWDGTVQRSVTAIASFK